MDKGKFYSGLAIMVGLMVLGVMIPKAVNNFRSFDRIVNVKGLCEREVKASEAGANVVIANGRKSGVLESIFVGRNVGTGVPGKAL